MQPRDDAPPVVIIGIARAASFVARIKWAIESADVLLRDRLSRPAGLGRCRAAFAVYHRDTEAA